MSINFFSAAIGTILGSLYFIIGNYSILIAGLVCLIISSTCFTGLSHRKTEILSLLTAFLIVFFNFNIRSEFIEYQNLENKINQDSRFIVLNNPKDYFFRSDMIIELIQDDNIKSKIKSLIIPIRLIAHSNSSKAISKGDIVQISGNPSIEKITPSKKKFYLKDKVFYELKKPNVIFKTKPKTFFTKIQNKIKNYYYSSLNETNAGIVTSLLMGSRVSEINKDFISQIRKLGLGHFFAASGFHLLILTLFVSWILSFFNLNLTVKNISIISISFIYAGLAGFSPSIIRALMFISIFLILQLLKRKVWSIKFLIYLAGLILFLDPYTMFDIGFQLSYLATLSLILWFEKVKERLNFIKIPNYFKDIIAVSISVQIFLLPLVIYYFNSIQIWSIVANLLFTPILSLIIILSFLGMSFLLEPLLNFLRFMIDRTDQLFLLNNHTEIDLTTMIILFIFFNTLALLAFNSDWQNYSKIKLNSELDEKIKQLITIISKTKIAVLSIAISSLLLILAINLDPPGTKKLIIENGTIINKKIPELTTKTSNYKYFDIYGKKALILKDRSSLGKLNGFLNEIKEVDILFLPNLNSKDIYLARIMKLLNPQFTITNTKNKSEKVKKNIELIGQESNIIMDSGILYISKDKFWSIKK